MASNNNPDEDKRKGAFSGVIKRFKSLRGARKDPSTKDVASDEEELDVGDFPVDPALVPHASSRFPRIPRALAHPQPIPRAERSPISPSQPRSTAPASSSTRPQSSQRPLARGLYTRNRDPRTLQHDVGLDDALPLKQCGKCKIWYTETYNSLLACTWHEGRVHFEGNDAATCLPSPSLYHSRYVPATYTWTCCGDVVGTSAGCVNSYHVPLAPGALRTPTAPTSPGPRYPRRNTPGIASS
ncbi:hypothetical protein F5Y16DRAFT_363526 [Xylariaceae sp. FL0255]|nr:hypothetical protein F5Y16DRAFT_363526 [Xylariaceae sp. FL0255]